MRWIQSNSDGMGPRDVVVLTNGSDRPNRSELVSNVCRPSFQLGLDPFTSRVDVVRARLLGDTLEDPRPDAVVHRDFDDANLTSSLP